MIYIQSLLYTALIFLSFGILSSTSALSIFQLLSLGPLLYYNLKHKSPSLPTSAYFLLACLLFSTISFFLNWPHIQGPMKAFLSLRHLGYSILCLLAFPIFFKDYLTPKKIKLLTSLLLLSIIVSTIFGTIKYKFGFDIIRWHQGAISTRNPGITGIMRYSYSLSLLLSPLFFLAINFKKKYREYIYFPLLILGILIGSAGLITSQSRGAILGFLCTIPIAFYFKNKNWGKKCFVGLFIILAAITYGISSQKISSLRFFQNFHSPSNLMRLAQYEASLLSFKENPWFGLGPKQFAYNVERVKKENHLFWGDYCQRFKLKCDYSHMKPHYGYHAHNIFLEKLANLGLWGFLCFSLWLIFWFIEMRKRKDLLGRMSLLFLTNLFIIGQVDYILSGTVAFLVFYMYSLSLSSLNLSPKNKKT